jgi:hypothetical protein
VDRFLTTLGKSHISFNGALDKLRHCRRRSRKKNAVAADEPADSPEERDSDDTSDVQAMTDAEAAQLARSPRMASGGTKRFL